MEQYPRSTVAIIGPSSSDAALQMSNVFSVWNIGMVSYAASSPLLDDRRRHASFLRTVPSDSYQVSAVLDVVRHFNWTYMVALSSCSNYEQKVLNTFNQLMHKDGRCLARMSILPCVRKASSYEYELKTILKDTKVRVVVMLTSKDDTIGMLKAAKTLNVKPGRLTWFGGTGWGNLDLKTYGIDNVASGAFTLVYPAPVPLDDFKKHFLSLNLSNNNYTYFVEYWEALFNCSATGYPNKLNRRSCSGTERLKDGIGWYSYTNVQPVFDAVLAAYRGFYKVMPYCPDNLVKLDVCNSHALVQAMYMVDHLMETSFESMPAGRIVTFGPRGGVRGRYDLLNFATGKDTHEYRKVGSWEAQNNVTTAGELKVLDNLIYWPDGDKVTISICSEPCPKSKGQIRVNDKNERLQFCCWSCFQCGANQIIINNTCVSCEELQMPNIARDSCVLLPEVTVKSSDTAAIVILCFSFLGFLGATFTVISFIYNYSSSIVKAAGRESSFLMLVGVYLCFVAPLVFLSRPTTATCGIQRFIAGLSFSVIYAPLFLKINRIFRIFQSAKTTTARPSLISPLSQVFISLGIILVQVLLGVVWIIGDPPRVERIFPKTNDKYKLFCRSDPYTVVLNLLICLALMIACTYYAFRTRHFPKNYNETKSIMYTLYFSCFAWGIFFPTYLLSNDVESFLRTYTIALFCNITGFVSLIGFFGPKIHLLLRKSAIVDSPASGTMIFAQSNGALRMKSELQHVIVEETEDHIKNSADLLEVKSSRTDATTQLSDESYEKETVS